MQSEAGYKATDAVLDEISNAAKQSIPPKLNFSVIKLSQLHIGRRGRTNGGAIGLSLIFFGSFSYQEKKERAH